MSAKFTLGFIPLIDAAALIVAEAKGFFADEGLEITLSREASWATVRDKLAVGALDGAHLLAPLALAATVGAGSEPTPLIAPMALNLNGPVVTLSTRLADIVGDTRDAAGLARLIARRREQGASQLTFAVVYPYSSQNYLLRAWLSEGGIDPDRDVRLTVAPPPRMADLLAEGVIEGFCVSEPWDAAAVARGIGRVAVRSSQFLDGTPDKVFGVTAPWAAAHPDVLQALLRSLIRAGAWIAEPGNRDEFVSILTQPGYVGADPQIIRAGLEDIVLPRDGVGSPVPAHALWLLAQMVRWGQIGGHVDLGALAGKVYRPDLFAAAQGA